MVWPTQTWTYCLSPRSNAHPCSNANLRRFTQTWIFLPLLLCQNHSNVNPPHSSPLLLKRKSSCEPAQTQAFFTLHRPVTYFLSHLPTFSIHMALQNF